MVSWLAKGVAALLIVLLLLSCLSNFQGESSYDAPQGTLITEQAPEDGNGATTDGAADDEPTAELRLRGNATTS